jgi:hypothetical protein
VVAVGPRRAVEAWCGPDTQRVDATGLWIVPGFIDSHTHLVGWALEESSVDLSGLTHPGAVAEAVARRARSLPPGELVLGHGWADSSPPPHRSWLDAAAPLNPVVLRRLDGHAQWVNTRALELCFGTQLPTALGGVPLQTDGSRELTGVFEERAAQALRRLLPPPSESRVREALQRCMPQLPKLGLTGVHDMGLQPAAVNALSALDQDGLLPIRVTGYWDGEHEAWPHWVASDSRLPTPARCFAMVGVKQFADGSLGARSAAMLAPYSDAPERRGLLLRDRSAIADAATQAARLGYQYAVHCIGDAALHEAALGLRAAASTAPLPRPRIEHAQVAQAADLRVLGELGAFACVQPTHAHSDAPFCAFRLGVARMRRAYLWGPLRRAGLELALGTDFPVDDPSPLRALFAARTRWGTERAVLQGWPRPKPPGAPLSPRAALSAATLGSARAGLADSYVGTLSVGKVADFVGLSSNPLADPPENLLDTRVMITVCAGRITHLG